jgi:hypothetical protein
MRSEVYHMAWIKRDARAYFYEFAKRNGVKTCTYYGSGEEAQQASQRLEQRKADRIKRKADRETFRARIEVDEQPLALADTLAYGAYTAWKISTGWHRHGRAWRRTGVITMRTIDKAKHAEVSKAIEWEIARRKFTEGDVDAKIQQYHGDIGETALHCFLTIMTDNVYTREAYRHAFLKLKASLLADQQSSPIAELVAHQLALSWLDSSYWDAYFYTQAHGSDLQVIDHYDRRRARAARRLARSIKVYADVMKVSKETVSERLSRFDLMVVVKNT